MSNELNTPTTLKKVIVASGTKVAIGDTLEEAISNLLSQSAVNIEVTSTEDLKSMLEAIINANNNLKQSSDSNDWEMIGSDIKNLQELIDSLEKMMDENDIITTENNTDEQNNTSSIDSIIQNIIN